MENKINPHFVNAAEILVKGMETPGKFLGVATDAMNWLNKMGETAKDMKELNDLRNAHFYLTVIINKLIPKWYEGGENLQSNLVSGMYELYDYSGHDGLNDCICFIIRGFGEELKQSILQPQYFDSVITTINTLNKIRECFYHVYEEMLMRTERKRAAA